ncbi:tranposase [Geobacillus stearothermophilus]|nr:tranposase [Geobacillus stearothermophilus]
MRMFLYGKGDQTNPLEEHSHVFSVYQRTHRLTRRFDSKGAKTKKNIGFSNFL